MYYRERDARAGEWSPPSVVLKSCDPMAPRLWVYWAWITHGLFNWYSAPNSEGESLLRLFSLLWRCVCVCVCVCALVAFVCMFEHRTRRVLVICFVYLWNDSSGINKSSCTLPSSHSRPGAIALSNNSITGPQVASARGSPQGSPAPLGHGLSPDQNREIVCFT